MTYHTALSQARQQEILRLIADARDAAMSLRDLAETADGDLSRSILTISEELACSASFAELEVRGEVR